MVRKELLDADSIGHPPESYGIVTDPNVQHIGNASSTSLGLLERARARDRAAWERLVALYGPVIDRWCRQAGLQEADATDVRQEVFLSVSRSIDTFRRDRPGDTFLGWLRVVTQNKVRDLLRRAPPEAGPAGGSDAYERLLQVACPPEPEGGSQANELSLIYRRALELIAQDFAESTWRAFWLVVVDGIPPAQAAAEVGLSVNAVYLAKGRVLARLREEFADLIDT